jgi:hypothetical protein
VSEFKSLTTTTSHGGAFYLDVPLSLTVIISDTTMTDNIAGTPLVSGDGGIMNIVTATTNVDITLLRNTFSGNKASGGKGGIFSIPMTSTSSIVSVTTCTFTTNEALTDGGLFYIGGTDAKQLLWTDSTVLNTKAKTGSGGLAYIAGSTSKIVVLFSTSSTTAQIKDNQALVNNGGLFYSVVTDPTALACEL